MTEALRRLVDALRHLEVIDDDSAVELQAMLDPAEGRATAAADEAADAGRERQEERERRLAERLAALPGVTEFQRQQLRQGKAGDLLRGDYVLSRELDRGGMGRVYLARHRLMGKDVVIKCTLNEDKSLRDRFRREVEAASKLSHPHIVASLNAGMAGDECFLVMEYVDGENLESVVRKRGPLSFAEALECVTQAAEGLAYAHEAGVIHRDIKPGNLLWDSQRRVKILDMGLARLRRDAAISSESVTAAASEPLTARSVVLGTVDYMAPEQAVDPRQAAEASDIYSLGCVLYFLVAGEPPYGPSQAPLVERILAHRDRDIPRISAVAADAPLGADELLAKMLAKGPEDRFASAPELLAALRQLRDGGRPSAPPKPWPPAAGRRFAGAAVLLLLAAAAWRVGGFGTPPDEPPTLEPSGSAPDAGASQTGARDGGMDQPSAADVPPTVTAPTDLLPWVDLSQDVLAGVGWSIQNGRLQVPDTQPSKLVIRVDPPANFLLEMSVTRVKGRGPFVVGVNQQGRRFYCRLGMPKPGGRTMTSLGTRSDNGKMEKNELDNRNLPIGRPVRLQFRVTSDSLRVAQDDQPLLQWEGDFVRLDLGGGWDTRDAAGLMVGGNGASFEVSDLILAPLAVEPTSAE